MADINDKSGMTAEMEQLQNATAPTAAVPDKPALREDQVQSAVAFLSHPKVRESPSASKRAFLERKGLTAAEIDEAFTRVPESAVAAPAQSSYPQAPNPGQTYQSSQPVAQGAKPFPQQPATGFVPQQAVPQQALELQPAPMQVVAPHPAGLRWSQVVLGVGVTAAAVLAVQHYVYPYIADTYKRLRASQRESQEAAQQREQHLMETVKELQATQKELQEHLQNMTGVMKSLKEEVEGVRAISAVATAGSAPRRNEVGTTWPPPPPDVSSSSRDFGPLRPNWGSRYNAEGLQQNGHWGGNGVTSQPPYKRTVQDTDYWKGPQTAPPRSTSSTTSEPGPQNPSYAEVVEMLQQGITPPNVRTDINDQPPDPSRPFSESRAALSAKPWQRGQVSYGSMDPDQRPHSPPFHASPSYPRSPAPPANFSYTATQPAQPPTLTPPSSTVDQQAGAAAPSMNTSSSLPTGGSSSSSSGLNTLGIDAARDASRVNVPSSGASGKSDNVWRPPPPPAPTVAYKTPTVGATDGAAAAASGNSDAAAGAAGPAQTASEAIAAEVGADE